MNGGALKKQQPMVDLSPAQASTNNLLLKGG
jgi:hypothetical protein